MTVVFTIAEDGEVNTVPCSIPDSLGSCVGVFTPLCANSVSSYPIDEPFPLLVLSQTPDNWLECVNVVCLCPVSSENGSIFS